MKTLFRDIRLLPVVLVAVISLAILKTAGLLLDGGYLFSQTSEAPKQIVQTIPPKAAQQVSQQVSWAQDMLGFPGGGKAAPLPDNPNDITGSVAAAPKPEAAPATKPAETKPLEGIPVLPDPRDQVSPSERAVLERLQTRRQELEARARELEIRENLIKAAEKRLESKVEEVKAIEQRIGVATERRNDAEVARLKGVVTMYEGMKPKDAARIFDRLEMPVLYGIASQIKPPKMAEILAQMAPESAERLTIELTRRASADKSAAVADLPKIEGRPK